LGFGAGLVGGLDVRMGIVLIRDRSAGVLRPSASTEGCATRSKAGPAVPWSARSVSEYAPVSGAGPGLELVQVGQAGVAAQVARGVDDGLDPLAFEV
jgi:hypothetical protein